MRRNDIRRIVLLALICLACTSVVQGQKLSPIQVARLKYFLKFDARLTVGQRNLLSQPTRNAIALAHQIFDPPGQPGSDGDSHGFITDVQAPAGAARVNSGARSAEPFASIVQNFENSGHRGGGDGQFEPGLTKISHPEIGLQLSRLGEFTENGSSTAKCGQTIVTGFSSRPAFTLSEVVPSIENPAIFTSSSEMGVAFSKDGGETFTELPFMNAGPAADPSLPFTFNFAVGGNASIGCSSSRRFYAASSPFLRFNATIDPTTGFGTLEILSGVGINISDDGGEHWSDPSPAVQKNEDHLIDSAWLAVDPRDAKRLYVSYVDTDASAIGFFPSPNPRCPGSIRFADEVVTSADGGRNWSQPTVLREDCQSVLSFLEGFVAGPARIAVGGDGRLAALYTLFTPVFDDQGKLIDQNMQINFRQSLDHGQSFAPEVKVSDVSTLGDGTHFLHVAVQGFFTVNTSAALTVDPVKHGNKTTIYAVWSDGRNNSIPDLTTPSGVYNFGDIVLSKSSDGGRSWTAPRAVSPTPQSFSGAGRDQFIPSAAVDREGTLAVCYFDRRNDPQNNALDRYCSLSGDGGQSFHDVRESARSWIPGENWDRLAFWVGEHESVIAPMFGEDSGGFFDSFSISANDVTGIFGRSVRHDRD